MTTTNLNPETTDLTIYLKGDKRSPPSWVSTDDCDDVVDDVSIKSSEF